MSFGSQEKEKSPSRMLRKILDSENNVNNLCSSPMGNNSRPEFDNLDSMIHLNSNSLMPSVQSEQ